MSLGVPLPVHPVDETLGQLHEELLDGVGGVGADGPGVGRVDVRLEDFEENVQVLLSVVVGVARTQHRHDPSGLGRHRGLSEGVSVA